MLRIRVSRAYPASFTLMSAYEVDSGVVIVTNTIHLKVVNSHGDCARYKQNREGEFNTRISTGWLDQHWICACLGSYAERR